jgi:hypothetical protein
LDRDEEENIGDKKAREDEDFILELPEDRGKRFRKLFKKIMFDQRVGKRKDFYCDFFFSISVLQNPVRCRS